MAAYTFANKDTGELSRKKFSGPPDSIAANTPAGMIAIEGDYDSICQRLDLNTREIVAYQPPKPSEDHEWTGTRWRLNANAQAQINEDKRARFLLAELDAKQARRVREILAATDPQMQAYEDQAVKLRERLSK